MKILCLAFENNEMIPDKYTCKGENINPELEFVDVPANAKSLALIMDDPDAPKGTFTHWVVYNIPPDVKSIPENSIPPGVVAKNSLGENSYMGPCPPSGVHRYFFKLYALSEILPITIQDKIDLIDKMPNCLIEEVELMGKFGS